MLKDEARNQWVDCARGIGIILVVYGHVLRGLSNAGLVAPNSAFWISDYAIYTFHMPLFFLLAGLFAEPSYAKGSRHFWIGKLQTVLYPYFLWSILQGLLLIAFSGLTNTASSISRLTSILWTPIAPFWFLYALFFCHLLFSILRSLDRRVMLLLGFAAYLVMEIRNYGLHDIDMLRDTARGFLFYALGVWSAGIPALAEWRGAKALGASVPGFVALATLGWTLSIPYEALLPAALAGIALVIAFVRLPLPASASLAFLGRNSMAIFVMHIMVASGVRIALLRLTPLRDSGLHLLIGCVAGIVIPLMIYAIVQRAGLAAWFGLPSPKRIAT